MCPPPGETRCQGTSERLQGDSWEPPSSPRRPGSVHPLLEPQPQPPPLALPVQGTVGEVRQQRGPTPMGGGWGWFRGSGVGALDLSKRHQHPPSPCWAPSSTGRSHWGPRAELPGSDWRPPGDETDGRGQGVRAAAQAWSLDTLGPSPTPTPPSLSLSSENEASSQPTGPLWLPAVLRTKLRS